MDPAKPRGAVEMAFRVRHNPERMGPRLYPQKTDTDDLLAEPSDVLKLEPNELVITLWRARELLIMDKKVLGSGGTSDPLVRFRVCADQTVTSTTKKKTCNPVWGGETWTLKADSPDSILDVIVDDYDKVVIAQEPHVFT